MRSYTNKKHEKKTFKIIFLPIMTIIRKKTSKLKRVEMKTLAKHRQINLKGSRKKDHNKHFQLIFYRFKPFEVIDNSFHIVSNDLGYINVSVWFRKKGKKLDV